MLFEDVLDHHQVLDKPHPLYMGELPRDYGDVPAPVVINVCGVFPPSAPLGMVVLGLPLYDCLDPELQPQRIELEAFLQTAHIQVSRRPSYWHCHAGLNRSGLALAGYLHLYHGMRISDAIDYLRERRSPMVLCNSSFERLLRTWYGTAEEQDFQSVPLDQWLRHREGR